MFHFSSAKKCISVTLQNVTLTQNVKTFDANVILTRNVTTQMTQNVTTF